MQVGMADTTVGQPDHVDRTEDRGQPSTAGHEVASDVGIVGHDVQPGVTPDQKSRTPMVLAPTSPTDAVWWRNSSPMRMAMVRRGSAGSAGRLGVLVVQSRAPVRVMLARSQAARC